MKKQQSRKLELARETLAPLQPDALERVAGGMTVVSYPCSATILISRLICPKS